MRVFNGRVDKYRSKGYVDNFLFKDTRRTPYPEKKMLEIVCSAPLDGLFKVYGVDRLVDIRLSDQRAWGSYNV